MATSNFEVESFSIVFSILINLIICIGICVYYKLYHKWEKKQSYFDMNEQFGSQQKADQYANLDLGDGMSNIESLLDKNYMKYDNIQQQLNKYGLKNLAN